MVCIPTREHFLYAVKNKIIIILGMENFVEINMEIKEKLFFQITFLEKLKMLLKVFTGFSWFHASTTCTTRRPLELSQGHPVNVPLLSRLVKRQLTLESYCPARNVLPAPLYSAYDRRAVAGQSLHGGRSVVCGD